MQALAFQSFKELYLEDVTVIDTRNIDIFKSGFVPGSIVLPFNNIVKEWIPYFITALPSVLLIADDNQSSQEWLATVGIKNVTGYLEGGYSTWISEKEPIDMIIDVEADELMMDISFDDKMILADVRKPVEFAEGHLKNAVNLPLDELSDPIRIAAFEETDNIYLYCSNGVRSMVAASLLKKHGVHNLRQVAGGWEAIKQQPNVQIVKDPGVLN